MAKKEIELLKEQVKKLDVKNFDLEAWKKYTIVLLARIFGDDSQKIKQIENIEYDYSSWALRDTSGISSYLNTCKKLGKEILDASISEIENFGLPEKEKKAEISEIIQIIIDALQDELKGSQFREIKEILKAKTKEEVKKKKVFDKFISYSAETANEILSNILVNSKISKEI